MRLRTAGTSIVVVAVMVVGAPAAGAAVPSEAGPDVLVTDDTALSRTHEASHLLVDHDSGRTYLSEVELQSGDCRVYTSADQGGSWEPVEATVDTPLEQEDAEAEIEPAPETEPHVDCGLGSTGPQNVRTHLAQGPDGTVYVAFHANDPDGEGIRSVLVGRSDDDGETWQTAVVAEAPDVDSSGEIEVNFEPHVAVDPDDPERVVVMWRRSYSNVDDDADSPPTRPWMAVSTDGGETFDEPFMMFDENPGFDGPRPVFADGRLHAFYRVSAPPTDEGEEPAPTRLMSAASDDGGESWEAHEIAAELDASEPIPAFDRDTGTFYAVWHDNRHGDLDVFFARSDDGQAWSDPVRLNDDELGNRVGQYYPQISLAPDGRIDVAWYDYRDNPNPPPPAPEEGPLGLFGNLGERQSVYLRSSVDGGETWADEVRVNDVTIDRTIGTWNSQYFVVVPVSVASFDEHAVVSWSDTRQGTAETATQDIYTSVVTAESGGQGASLLMGGVAVALLAAGATLLIAVAVMRRSRAGVEQPAASG